MSTTPNLLIDHIATNQNQKEVTANRAFDELDSALTNNISIAMGNADVTLTTAQGGQALGNMVFVFTGANTAARNVITPTSKKLYIVNNSTTGGFKITVKTPSGTGIDVHQTDGNVLLYCDGTNIVAVAGTGGATSRIASIHFTIDGAGSPPSTGVAGQISIPFACTITGWAITGDVSGSAVVDVLRSTFSGFPTTSSIAGSDKPTLSSAQKAQDTTLTGWGSTALNQYDELQVNLNSVTTITRIDLDIYITIP